jgi:uncharacterized cupredoxin-like copper-binding protein
MKIIRILVAAILLFGLSFSSAEAATQMIMMTESGFLPNQLQFSKGERVQLIVNNTDHRVHNLVIPELQVNVPHLMKGEMAVSNFTADKEGTYKFYSNTPGYQETSYVGQITIREKK